MKPFSQASDNNKAPILEVLVPLLSNVRSVLEIGSGSGQHAVYFAPHLPHLVWQCSDLPEHHPGIVQWIEACPAANIRNPVALDVTDPQWPIKKVDAVYSANTAHIMSWQAVTAMFRQVPQILTAGGLLVLYGPFNRNGEFTSASNERFHHSLIGRNPEMGIRDDQDLIALGDGGGLGLDQDIAMPANNRILVWKNN